MHVRISYVISNQLFCNVYEDGDYVICQKSKKQMLVHDCVVII